MATEPRARLSVTADQASVVEDALSYFLAMSEHNWGAGWEGENRDDVEQLLYERSLVADFEQRCKAAHERLVARG